MNRYRISEHLYLDEIVPVLEYDKYVKNGHLDRLVRRFDKSLITAFEKLRVEIGVSGIINNWWSIYVANDFDGVKTFNEVESKNYLYQWSGWRPPNTPFYKVDSMHSYFKAFDVKWGGIHNVVENKKAQKVVNKNWKKYGITGMELRNGWVHIDTRFIYNQEYLMIF